MPTAAKLPPRAGSKLGAASSDAAPTGPPAPPETSTAAQGPPPSPRTAPAPPSAGRALDWFNLFVANIQTGFGPFIAVYLASQRWTQTAIGLALSIGTIAAMASQVPAGALVDAISNKTRVAAFSVLSFTACALMFAVYPIPLFVYLAEILHGLSSCTLGPATAAISLVIAGQLGMGLRLGRNARYAAIGNGLGAALMGACGQYISERAVFWLTAVLTLPALVALIPLRKVAITKAISHGPAGSHGPRGHILKVLSNKGIVVFSCCAMLFTFANAPMLMLMSGTMTTKVGNPSLLIAACIVLPQIIVAAASPAVGRFADKYGRKMVLAVGFAALPLRGLAFAFSSNQWLVIAVQALDGVGGACFGVLMPLVISDVAGRTRHFNLSLGCVGFAVGVGGTLSTPAAGWLADHYGTRTAFYALAAVGLAAVVVAAWLMPETRPDPNADDQ
jgi:MFS family permease